jgi:hypothetical protein
MTKVVKRLEVNQIYHLIVTVPFSSYLVCVTTE